MTDNTVTVIGTLGKDPEVRYAASGAIVVTFGVAVNRRWNKGGEWQEETSWFDVTCFAQLGENVAESCQRGTRVIVTGRLQQRTWETEAGDKRSKVEIVADEVAPSLRWATAQVTKIERTPSGGASGGAQPVKQYAGGEEPFARLAEVADL